MCFLANIWNKEISLNKNFPENLKLDNIKPVFFKKRITFFVASNRPVSVLPTASPCLDK